MTETVDDPREMIDRSYTEKEWLTQVTSLAGGFGWLVYHTFNSQRSTAGFPDLVLVRSPRIVFAELKRQRDAKVSPEQLVWLIALRDCGVGAYIWRPSDWKAVQEVLR